METINHLLDRLAPVLTLLMALAAVNYGLVALFDWNLFTEVFRNGVVLDVVYMLVAIAGVLSLDKIVSSYKHVH